MALYFNVTGIVRLHYTTDSFAVCHPYGFVPIIGNTDSNDNLMAEILIVPFSFSSHGTLTSTTMAQECYVLTLSTLRYFSGLFHSLF